MQKKGYCTKRYSARLYKQQMVPQEVSLCFSPQHVNGNIFSQRFTEFRTNIYLYESVNKFQHQNYDFC